jgi:hypothetical protein
MVFSFYSYLFSISLFLNISSELVVETMVIMTTILARVGWHIVNSFTDNRVLIVIVGNGIWTEYIPKISHISIVCHAHQDVCVTAMLLTQLYVRVSICLACGKHLLGRDCPWRSSRCANLSSGSNLNFAECRNDMLSGTLVFVHRLFTHIPFLCF